MRRNFLVQNRAAGSGPHERNQKEQVGDRQKSGTGSVGVEHFKQEIHSISARNLRISERGISRFPREESVHFRVRNLFISA
jgi:hypothetical protein